MPFQFIFCGTDILEVLVLVKLGIDREASGYVASLSEDESM